MMAASVRDAVVTGYGLYSPQGVRLLGRTSTVVGGSLSEVVRIKICKVMDLAVKYGCPRDRQSPTRVAPRIQEGSFRSRVRRNLLRNVQSRRASSEISLVMGPCAVGAVYSPAPR